MKTPPGLTDRSTNIYLYVKTENNERIKGIKRKVSFVLLFIL